MFMYALIQVSAEGSAAAANSLYGYSRVIALPWRLAVNVMMMAFPWKPFMLTEWDIMDSALSTVHPSILGFLA